VTTLPLAVPARRTDRLLDGAAVRDIVPVTLAVAPLGFVVGVSVPALDIPRSIGLAAAPLLYSGSTQLTFLTLAAAGAGLLSIVGTLLLVNARLVLYSAALAPRFRGQPAWFRWLTPTFVVDQTFALVSGRRDLDDPARFRRYWLTIGGVLGLGWSVAVACGTILGPVVPDAVPLELTAPALFVGLVVPKLRDPRDYLGAAVATGAALLGHGPLGSTTTPVAIAVAITVLGLTERPRPAPPEDVA
jgi:predicted branched-subunit amino acid permease